MPVTKKTNLLPHSTFIRGPNGWATPRNTAGATANLTQFATSGDFVSLYYGRTAYQLYAESSGKNMRLASASSFAVDPSTAYKIGAVLLSETSSMPSCFRVFCYSATGAHTGTLFVNFTVSSAITSPNSNLCSGIVNAVGGAGPSWPSGTVSAIVDVGFNSTGAQGLYVFSFWCIADSEYPGSISTPPVNAAAGGTHEAVSVGGHIYVINHSINQVVKFDNKLRKVATVNVGSYPHDIVCVGGDLWVANQNARTLQRINLSSFSVTNTYNIPGNRAGFGLATDGARLWCGAGGFGQSAALYEVDVNTGAFSLLSTDINDGGDTNTPVRFLAGSVWSANLTTGQVKRIDPDTGTTLATINCNLNMIYGLGSGEGYVFANCREGIAQIAPDTNAIVAKYRYRETFNGQSNVEVLNGKAYGTSTSGLLICDLATRTSTELMLDAGSNKWVRAMPDGALVLVGAYAGPWMFLIEA